MWLQIYANEIKDILVIEEVKNNKLEHITKDTKQIKQKSEKKYWKESQKPIKQFQRDKYVC